MIPLFIIPFIVWWLIQSIKAIIDAFLQQTFTRDFLWNPWGFPSVHSGIAASVSTLMFFIYGRESAPFAISITFSFLFWYDAANIRYEAGQHATFLNTLSEELHELTWDHTHCDIPKNTHHHTHSYNLKERLGHTVTEVLWGILIWIILTRLILSFVSIHPPW